MDRHERLKQLVKTNPSLIGVQDVMDVQEEVECRRSNGELYCVPDLVFHLEDSYVVVEVKSSGEEHCLDKLEQQLRRAYIHFKVVKGILVRTIGVYLDESGIQIYERCF
ncbi:MAG: hypothetical protein ACE5FT_04855 [Candidatus Nanoarchaeia archaeon]